MKKLIQISVLSLFVIFGFSNNLFAQSTNTKKDVFEGIWQAAQFVTQGEKSLLAALPVLKIFDGYGNFTTVNLAAGEKGSVVTMKGKYKILSDSVYIEEITDAPNSLTLKGKSNTIKYTMSENGNKVDLRFNLEFQNFSEEWRKVSLYDPSIN